MNTKRLTEKNMDEAAAILRDGGLVGIPTETVYGLGANGLNEEAVAHIFEAKGRPPDNPLILSLIHIYGHFVKLRQLDKGIVADVLELVPLIAA